LPFYHWIAVALFISILQLIIINEVNEFRVSYQFASRDPSTKKYINPSSFQSMLKSYGKELPTLTFIHHIRGSYQEEKKEGWKNGS